MYIIYIFSQQDELFRACLVCKLQLLSFVVGLQGKYSSAPELQRCLHSAAFVSSSLKPEFSPFQKCFLFVFTSPWTQSFQQPVFLLCHKLRHQIPENTPVSSSRPSPASVGFCCFRGFGCCLKERVRSGKTYHQPWTQTEQRQWRRTSRQNLSNKTKLY